MGIEKIYNCMKVVKCPNCRVYELSFWEKLCTHNYYPSECPNCKELYVNSTLWGLMGFIVLLFLICTAVSGVSSYINMSKHAYVCISIPFFSILAFFVRPIQYSSFQPYGKREIWKSVFIFGFIPLALVTVILSIVISLQSV